MAATRKPKRRTFASQQNVTQTILDGDGNVYGHIRISPASVGWKAKSGREFRTKSINDFEKWITGK